MKRTNKEYLALIDETINFYGEDISRRAVVNGRCFYDGINNDGKTVSCAVGRCLTDEIKAIKRIEGVSVNGLVDRLANTKQFFRPDLAHNGYENLQFDDIFKDEYKGFEKSFWKQLQRIHDRDDIWNKKGLNTVGLILVEDLKEQYKS